MSDVERPSSGGNKKVPGGLPSHGLPAKNMADIARLFLEGARPLPTRIGPGQRAAPRPPAPAPKPAEAPRERVAAASARATAVLGLSGARTQDANWKLLLQVGHGLAHDMSTAVAVVGLLGTQEGPAGGGAKKTLVVDVIGVESLDELPVVRTAVEAGGSGGGSGGNSDMHVARALHRLAPAIGLWIVAAPPSDAKSFPAIASIVREWLLACPTDNDGLICGYQYLKQAWTRAGGKESSLTPTVYLLSEDYAQAAVVHKRLRKAAQEFLGTDLALAGAGPGARVNGVAKGNGSRDGGGVGHEAIRVLSVACMGPDDAVWAAVLDEVCPMTDADESLPPTEIESALDYVESHADQVAMRSSHAAAAALDHLAQVLDPEERAALAADFEEPGVPVATARRPREIPGKVPDTAPASSTAPSRGAEPTMLAAFESPATTAAAPVAGAARSTSAPMPPVSPTAAPVIEHRKRVGAGETKIENAIPTLRAFDADVAPDRAAQWAAVERSLPDLAPASALLEARPPQSVAGGADTCLAVDAQGRVNVWTLYRDGASWFALREWATEHRNLLALTRRDLAVDKDAEAAVHIVLPLETLPGPTADDAAAMLVRAAARYVHIYRLRLLTWNGRQGIVVVPLA